MLNLTKFYYLNSTTITFSFTECKTDNFIGLFQNLKKNSKIIEVVTTDYSMTLFLREAMNHDKILDIINQSINSNKKNDNKSKKTELALSLMDTIETVVEQDNPNLLLITDY